MEADYVHKDTLTATDYVELNKNNELLISYNQALLKENQELKKQLKNCYCNRTDCIGRIKDSKKYDSLVQAQEAQQKEFIKYLEDEIQNCEAVSDLLFNSNREMKVYKEILKKYKEIVNGTEQN